MSYDVLEICRHVINYSNEKDYGISNLKLQKVLYLIQDIIIYLPKMVSIWEKKDVLWEIIMLEYSEKTTNNLLFSPIK